MKLMKSVVEYEWETRYGSPTRYLAVYRIERTFLLGLCIWWEKYFEGGTYIEDSEYPEQKARLIVQSNQIKKFKIHA